MMKTITKITMLLLVLFAIGCSKDEDETPVVVESSAKQLTSFVFNAADNAALDANLTATIDEAAKTISASVPFGTDVSSLTPIINVSAKASVNPSGAQDFSSEVSYVVTAEDGTTAAYSAGVIVLESENSAPLEFDLIAVTDNAVGVDVYPTFSWNVSTDPDNDSVTYDLYIDESGAADQLYAENLTDTTFEVTERLGLLQEYTWRVVAKDPKGAFASSVTRVFTTRAVRFNNSPITANPAFGRRSGYTSVVFDNKIWVMGGQVFEQGVYRVFNDVWFSEDGNSWTEATSAAEFTERSEHTAVVFDNKIWIIGGINVNDRKNDVWFSSDGKTWEEATDAAPFEGRKDFSSVVFDNKIWVLNGEVEESDIWFSADGITWSKSRPGSGRRKNHASVVFDNKIYTIAGVNTSNVRDNLVLSSVDGMNWEVVTSTAPFSERSDHSAIVFDNKIWVIGGSTDNGRVQDVWFSSDGFNWEEATSQGPFGESLDLSSVVFDNKVWVIGGSEGVWTFE